MFTRVFGLGVDIRFLPDGTVETRFNEQAFVDQFGDGYAETFEYNNGERETFLLPFELRSTYAQREGQLFPLLSAMAEDASAFITGNDSPEAIWLQRRMFRRANLYGRSWDGRDRLLEDEM